VLIRISRLTETGIKIGKPILGDNSGVKLLLITFLISKISPVFIMNIA
jgi:hypothetical protein